MRDLALIIESSPEWRLFAALAVGLLIGIERERHKHDAATGPAYGLRTFALVSFLGGLAAQIGSPVILGLAGGFTISVALLGFWMSAHRERSVTTEVTLVIAVLLGMLAQSKPGFALAASVVVVLVVASRIPLHRFVREILTEQDMRDGMVLSIAALVVLPLLPNHAVDPFGLVNPFALWRLAVVLMGLSAISYCAMRVLGQQYGLLISGFVAGFVSSTAAIAAMAGRAKNDITLTIPCAAGAVASILGSLLFLAALVGAANPDILQPLMKSFGMAVIFTLTYTVILAWRARAAESLPIGPSRAFDLRTIAIFAGLVAVFALISWSLMTWLGQAGIFASVMATALIDAHAASVSVATLVASGKISSASGAFAILVGFSANMAAKIPAAFVLGPPHYAGRVTVGIILLMAGLWSGYAWTIL